ncbi:response regulator transcription factor [Limisalsivibrio acetivorans]|uniref:response regulator transcription factor n=1 Tax=Limisalsivibrio acetivorans TaxID=1304888 RepID=UPI0003B4B105|nr:response regulator [Limisalsivibrio acetivorans]
MSDIKLEDLKVLCVEDDEIARLSIVNIIRRRVGEIYTAENGEVGLSVYSEKSPDIIVADLAMPIMDGLVMIDEIRKEDTEIPIIVITAFPDQARKVDKADYVMVKPVHKDMLLETLDKCVRKLNERGAE